MSWVIFLAPLIFILYLMDYIILALLIVMIVVAGIFLKLIRGTRG